MSIQSHRWHFVVLAVAMMAVNRQAYCDIVRGADWYVYQSEVVIRVRAVSDNEAANQGKQVLSVLEVLKGVFPGPTFEWDGQRIDVGSEAFVLVPFQYPAQSELATQIEYRTDEYYREKTRIWKINGQGIVDAGVGLHSISGPMSGGKVTIDGIRRLIAVQTPEAPRLHVSVVAAMFEPEMFALMEASDPDWARYVQFVIAIHDWERNIPFLARFVDSPEAKIASAASETLRKVTRGAIDLGDMPTLSVGNKSIGFHALSQGWEVWWQKHRAELVWNSSKATFEVSRRADVEARKWPVVPKAGNSTDDFPPQLIAALEQANAPKFSVAFQEWLDSGVLRDRSIAAVGRIGKDDEGAIAWLSAGEIRPFPLSQKDLFDANIPTLERLKGIALVAQAWHFERFAAERKAANEVVKNTKDLDLLRRAAFWEPLSERSPSAGRVALLRLADQTDAECQALLVRKYLSQRGDDVMGAVRKVLKAKRPVVSETLLAYISTHNDENAKWAARLLCQEKDPRVVPTLLRWLNDGNVEVRRASAFNLSWLPLPELAGALIAAIEVEKDAQTKEEMIVALAQTGDRTSMPLLISSANEPYSPATLLEVARGLTRIHDIECLPSLVKLARIGEKNEDLQLTMEAVNGFGRISQRFPSQPAAQFWTSNGVDSALIARGMRSISDWESEQLSAGQR